MNSLWGSKMEVLPEELGSIKPGSEWCWEPLKIELRTYIRVERIERKVDGDWWVFCVAIRDGGGLRIGMGYWNQLSRFIEAAVLTKPVV